MTITPGIEKIKNIIIETVPTVEKIYLFCSYAYGTPNDDSDYDFYVLVPDDSEREHDIYIAISKALREQGAYNKSMDILVHKYSHFEEAKLLLNKKKIPQYNPRKCQVLKCSKKERS